MDATMDADRMAVGWAAGVLTKAGAKLHPASGRFAWDVEMPNGVWIGVNTVAELCAAARAARDSAPTLPTST